MAKDSASDPAASDPAKDKFREALERKRGKQHPHEAASQHDSKVHDAQGAATKRMFRRKSGG
jgi:hypothetical protein